MAVDAGDLWWAAVQLDIHNKQTDRTTPPESIIAAHPDHPYPMG